MPIAQTQYMVYHIETVAYTVWVPAAGRDVFIQPVIENRRVYQYDKGENSIENHQKKWF